MTDEELARERSLQHDTAAAGRDRRPRVFGVAGAIYWLAVGVPPSLAHIALAKAAALF
jgi:hypothetical protein